MRNTYDTAMRRGVFVHEGGYTNHPSDPGGPTNWGITIADMRNYRNANATADDVRNMPKDVAEDIYIKHYAAPLRYDDLPAGVDYTVLDYGINSGIGRAGKVLRRVMGLPDNSSLVTDEVLLAVSKRDPKDLIKAINDERLRFLKSLRTWPVFGPGWERRVIEVRALSLNFAGNPGTWPVVLSNKLVAGKGAAPEPKAIKNATVVVGGAGGTGIVAWARHHPELAVLAGIGAAIGIGCAFYWINRWQCSQQEAATPGIVVVPEKAA